MGRPTRRQEIDAEPPQAELRRQWFRALLDEGFSPTLELLEVDWRDGECRLYELLLFADFGVVVLADTYARERDPAAREEDMALRCALAAEGWGVLPVTHRSLVRPRVRREVFLSLLLTFGQGFRPAFERIRRRVLH